MQCLNQLMKALCFCVNPHKVLIAIRFLPPTYTQRGHKVTL